MRGGLFPCKSLTILVFYVFYSLQAINQKMLSLYGPKPIYFITARNVKMPKMSATLVQLIVIMVTFNNYTVVLSLDKIVVVINTYLVDRLYIKGAHLAVSSLQWCGVSIAGLEKLEEEQEPEKSSRRSSSRSTYSSKEVRA